MKYTLRRPVAGGGYLSELLYVQQRTPPQNAVSSTVYTYDGQGRLSTAVKGNKEVVYSYPDSASVQVVEQSASAPYTPYNRTVYSYGTAARPSPGSSIPVATTRRTRRPLTHSGAIPIFQVSTSSTRKHRHRPLWHDDHLQYSELLGPMSGLPQKSK